MIRILRLCAVVFALAVLGRSLAAQQPAAAPPAGTARAVSPIDLTGYWVSVVTEDWRFRMVTPPKGDIMRVPGRLHISWQDDTTLKIETDAGQQTRLLHFTGAPGGEASWQGYSAATWEMAGAAGGGRGGNAPAAAGGTPQGAAGRGAPPPPRGGSLKVVTTRLKEGYLRKNGVPYSENTVVTEYFDRHNESNGDQWFTVTTIVEDPKYLQQTFITSTHFKKEADASKWYPAPCKAS